MNTVILKHSDAFKRAVNSVAAGEENIWWGNF